MRLKFCLLFIFSYPAYSVDYHVGVGQDLATIGEVPWATLMPGDRVYIHWQDAPYKEKWVINRQGTAENRIEIIGVNGPQGQQPVIDGNAAVTAPGLNFWNESRGVIKIGGSNTPADGLPTYITIENLEIRSARPAYQFTDNNGQNQPYSNNAASIYVEKGANIIIRNCTIHDSGNGIFMGAFNGLTETILFEGNYIFDNGIVNRIFEHNTYTSGIDVTYQYNRFGPLRTGAGGNNLKDRSAGLVVRYNWVESGNRQLDLVDADGIPAVVEHPLYNSTHVYGNVLIEPDGAGNSQIIHYGGDSGIFSDYRKGDLYLYNNTIISTRSGNTTLVRLSTGDETAQVFNNILYPTANGNSFAIFNGSGTLNLGDNWLKSNWQDCHCSPAGTVNDDGTNIEGSDPLFINFAQQNFQLSSLSDVVNEGRPIPTLLLPIHDLTRQYIKHQSSELRPVSGNMDMGAYEYCGEAGCDLIFADGFE